MKGKTPTELALWFETSKESRGNLDKFYWYWTTFSGATLVLLFNFLKDLGDIDPLSKQCLRFSVWTILTSFLLSPVRNYLNNEVTRIYNLLNTDKDVDDGKSISRKANVASFIRNVSGMLSVLLYILGLILLALASNILFLS